MNRSTETTRNQILLYLSNGQFHSGEALGHKLGISRAAVSKHIQSLSSLGVDIFSVTGKGYRLAGPLELLDRTLIIRGCQRYHAPLHVLSVVDSTNTYIKQSNALHQNGGACLAEAQTAGRGRQGRKWVSPFGASLYLSMYWGFQGGYQVLGGLSLAIGVAVVEALETIGVSTARLKWPNDIYLNGKKLAGILVEVESQLGDVSHCFMGIGLNIRWPSGAAQEIDQPWTDLCTDSDIELDRNNLASVLLDCLHVALLKFEAHGLAPFVDAWRSHNLFQNKTVRLLCGQQSVSGTCRGINEQGALLVETDKGVQAFYGGEISVRSHA